MKKLTFIVILVMVLLVFRESVAQDIGSEIVDREAPIIALRGNSTETVELGTEFIDAGVTAIDIYDGDLTSTVIVIGTVDTNVEGIYELRYIITDASGNTAEITRTVNVVDTATPTTTDTESNTSSLTDNDPLVNLPSSSTSVTLGDTLTIQATISGTSPINQVVVSFETVDYNMTQFGDSDTYEVTLDATQLPQDLGVYAYSVIAIDENGNIGSSASTLEVEPYFFTEVLDWLTFWN